MGNECCASRKNPGCVFSDSEIERLIVLYDDLVEYNGGQKAGLSLQRLFPENLELGDLVARFMQKNGHGKKISYETFESSSEVLIKEAAGYQLTKYLGLEKVDVLALVILDQGYIPMEELKRVPVVFHQAGYYVDSLLRMFHYFESNPEPVDSRSVRVVIDGVFKDGPESQVSWWQFLEHIKTNLLYANRCLQFYFTAKFLQRPVRLRLPALNQTSSILTRDLLGLIYLSNMYLHPIDKLECLHSSQYSSTSFQSLAQILQKYNGPTILIIAVTVPTDQTNRFVLGSFSLSRWKDGGTYHGNNGTHIFSLIPTFQIFLPNYKGTQESNNFMFLNSSGTSNVGIGFGGDSRGYRMWIDGQDSSRSYTKAGDGTFRNGPMIGEYDGPMKVEYVEVWGLGADLSLVAEANFGDNDLIVRKPWLTFNQSKIAELTASNPSATKNLADFETKIMGISQSDYQNNDVRFQGAQGASLDYSLPVKPQEKQKKSAYRKDPDLEGRNTYNFTSTSGQLLDDYAQRERSTYAVTDGYYNPFKERNEPIVRRLSQNNIATQSQNQKKFGL